MLVGLCGRGGGGRGRTFWLIFWAVVPLVQKAGELLLGGWDVEEINVDGGGCGADVDVGGVGLEVFDCIIGGGGIEITIIGED